MSKIRQERTAEQIRVILSELMLRDVSDPRLQSVTITRVTIDRELQHANVFVNALGDEESQPEVMAALEKASGFFRYELAQRLQSRVVPELHFNWDPTLVFMDEVNNILDNLDIPPAQLESDEPDTAVT